MAWASMFAWPRGGGGRWLTEYPEFGKSILGCTKAPFCNWNFWILAFNNFNIFQDMRHISRLKCFTQPQIHKSHNFPKFCRARSRLYRSRFLQVNMFLKQLSSSTRFAFFSQMFSPDFWIIFRKFLHRFTAKKSNRSQSLRRNRFTHIFNKFKKNFAQNQ